MIAYHFVDKTLRDGSPIPPNGKWLIHKGPVVICKSGLHFSIDPFDALQYAPGPILCKVEVEEVISMHQDKGVCLERKIIGRVNATEMLRYFARMQALSVAHLWDAPDIVLDYLMTGDETIRSAAGDAAWATYEAAENATWAAKGAAERAARAAEGAAEGAAERAAERAAKGAAEGAAAWAAARAARAAEGAAAWAAARASARAAWAAAWAAERAAEGAAARNTFNELVSELKWQ